MVVKTLENWGKRMLRISLKICPNQEIISFECQGISHKVFEYPTRIRRLQIEDDKKRLFTTLSDDEENPNT